MQVIEGSGGAFEARDVLMFAAPQPAIKPQDVNERQDPTPEAESSCCLHLYVQGCNALAGHMPVGVASQGNGLIYPNLMQRQPRDSHCH